MPAGANQCEIPKQIKPEQSIQMQAGCNLAQLGLQQQKFTVVPSKGAATDFISDRQYVAIADQGLIFHVNTQGEVLSIMKTQPWQDKKAKDFRSLMESAHTPRKEGLKKNK